MRRAKLYYLRDRTGKSARIAEKIRKNIGIDVDVKSETVNEENLAPVNTELEVKKDEAPKVEAKKEEVVNTEAKKEGAPKVEAKDKKESLTEKK